MFIGQGSATYHCDIWRRVYLVVINYLYSTPSCEEKDGLCFLIAIDKWAISWMILLCLNMKEKKSSETLYFL